MGLFCCCFDNRREARCRFLFLLHLRSHHVLSEVLVQQDAVIDSSSAAASGSVPAAAETRTVGARLACQTSTVKRGLIPPFVAGAHAPWCFVFVISTSGPLIAVVRLIELGEVGLVDVGEGCVAGVNPRPWLSPTPLTSGLGPPCCAQSRSSSCPCPFSCLTLLHRLDVTLRSRYVVIKPSLVSVELNKLT